MPDAAAPDAPVLASEPRAEAAEEIPQIESSLHVFFENGVAFLMVFR